MMGFLDENLHQMSRQRGLPFDHSYPQPVDDPIYLHALPSGPAGFQCRRVNGQLGRNIAATAPSSRLALILNLNDIAAVHGILYTCANRSESVV
jgi:hypothetical protein